MADKFQVGDWVKLKPGQVPNGTNLKENIGQVRGISISFLEVFFPDTNYVDPLECYIYRFEKINAFDSAIIQCLKKIPNYLTKP